MAQPRTGRPPTRARAERLAGVARSWAAEVDLIIGGHVPDGWVGELAGTPAGHARVFAASVLAIDLPGEPGARPTVRGWLPVPATRPRRATPATEPDLMWLFAVADDRPAVVELRPGELAAMVARHDAITDPGAQDADWVWWNWSRMPAGMSVAGGEPGSVAVMPSVVPRLAELLERDLVSVLAATGARAALLRALERVT